MSEGVQETPSPGIKVEAEPRASEDRPGLELRLCRRPEYWGNAPSKAFPLLCTVFAILNCKQVDFMGHAREGP